MSDTLRLKLPQIAAAQAQKHVTHNEGLAVLDALVQLAVASRASGDPPVAPEDGDRWIVGPAATGAWAGRADRIAEWSDGVWRFHAPRTGWTAYVADEAAAVVFDGTAWTALSGGASAAGTFSTLGVNASPDATNRVAVSAANLLFTDEGAGLQFKVNKTGAGDTGSFLFQSGWSGRAEFGLIGGDDFKLKVSADGATWHEVLAVDRSSRIVAFGSAGTGVGTDVANTLPIYVAGSERWRTDAWGRIILGHTASLAADGNHSLIQTHYAGLSGYTACRWANDASGARITIAKSRSTTIGAIGTPVQSGDNMTAVFFCADDGASLLHAASVAVVVDGAVSAGVVPTRMLFRVHTGSAVSDALRIDSTRVVRPGADNAQTLGSASARWSVVYAATSTISTSDAVDKRWLGAAAAPVIAAGRAITDGLGLYQWLDAVALKGEDGARLHLGVTAQAVAAAFAGAGLDVARYALWTATPLTETVEEAVEEIDEDGTATWTAVSREVPVLDEAGAQRLRFGIRYDQLSMLLHAAAAARMDGLDARLAALEAA